MMGLPTSVSDGTTCEYIKLVNTSSSGTMSRRRGTDTTTCSAASGSSMSQKPILVTIP